MKRTQEEIVTMELINYFQKRIKKLELQVAELKSKHILMEKAIERKAGMLEPIRKESWRFKK